VRVIDVDVVVLTIDWLFHKGLLDLHTYSQGIKTCISTSQHT